MKKSKYIFLIAAVAILCLGAFLLQAGAESEKKVTVESFTVKCVTEGKDTFYEGQSFSVEGYEGTLYYSDGSKETVPSSKLKFTVDDPLVPDSDPSKKTYVTFSCSQTDLTCGLPIKVIALSSLSVSGSYKTEYRVGEDMLDTANMEIKVVYSDGKEISVKASECTFSADTSLPLTENDSKVTVSYTVGSHTVSCNINLTLKKISALNIVSAPDKKYYEGSLFTCTGDELKLSALYEGEADAVTVSKWTIENAESPLIAGSDGKSVITVSVGGKTATFSVDIIKVTEVTATRKSVCNLYAGDIFNPEKITVTATFEDGSSQNVTSSVDFIYPEKIVAGSTVKAYYAGHEVSLSEIVIVHSAKLEVIKQPTKNEYSVGESFDPTGMIAVLTYDDGSTVRLSATDVEIQVPSPLTESDSIAKVIWNGYTADCTFSVFSDKRISRIEIVTQPTTLRYITGQPLNIDGIEVMVYYEGSSEGEAVDASKLTTVPELGSPITSDMRSYTVRYKISETVYYDATQIIEVTEKTPKALIVTSLPAIDKFYEGSEFNPDGLTVSLVYNDGTVLQVSDYTLSQGSDPFILSSNDAYQDVSITVSYAGFETDFKVTVVAKKVKSLTLISQPTKTVYRIGETFDTTGMKVLLTYTDTTITPVLLSEDDYIVTPTGKLTAEDTHAYVTFRGLTVSIDIEVNASGTHQETSAADTSVITLPPDITTVYIETGSPEPMTSYTPYITSSSPETSGTPSVVTTSGNQGGNTGGKTTGGSATTLTVLWIIVIIIFFIGIVVLIIYYKRHFM